MARSSYVAELSGALDRTIADLERQTGSGVAYGAPVAPDGSVSPRTTGAPAPPAPRAPAPVPVPVPGAPQQQAAEAASAPQAGAYGAAPGALPPPLADVPYAPAAAPPPEVIAGNLSTQIRRLEELRRWVHDDPTFGRLVDDMIGRQVHAAEKRQRVYTAVFSVASLVVGWLLPVLVPVTNFLHH